MVPFRAAVWDTSYPGSDSLAHGASATLWGESICLSSGEICSAANSGADNARKARIKLGLLHAGLVLPTNKIIHFYRLCLTSATAPYDRQEIDEHWGKEGREEKRKEEIPLYKGKLQSCFQRRIAGLTELFKGFDDQRGFFSGSITCY